MNEAYIVRRGGASTAALKVALGAYATPTASGAIASFDDGAEELPVKSLVIDIEPTQAGCTGIKIIRAGKNLLKSVPSSQVINGVTFTLNADGTVTANGTATAVTDLYYVGAVNVYADAGIPTGNYLVNGGSLPASSVGSLFIVPEGSAFTAHAGNGDLSFSFDANKKYRIFYRINAGQIVNNLVISLMVRLPSDTNNIYEPYKAIDSYSIDFPAEAGTVYSGTLDVKNGVLMVDSGSGASGNYQLPPTTVETLLGFNNIWADAGDISVTYRADPTIIYEKLTNTMLTITGGQENG